MEKSYIQKMNNYHATPGKQFFNVDTLMARGYDSPNEEKINKLYW